MRAQVRIDFQRRGKVQTFSRARVQAIGDGVQLALRVPRQVRALGQVLAQQAIGVLIGAALPRTMRIRKEDLNRKPLGQPLVLGHLFPPVIGQRFPQQRRDVPELLGEALAGTSRIRKGKGMSRECRKNVKGMSSKCQENIKRMLREC